MAVFLSNAYRGDEWDGSRRLQIGCVSHLLLKNMFPYWLRVFLGTEE
jgi:hypothetical protein